MIRDQMNPRGVHPSFYQPPHTILGNPNYIPLDPNYFSGFIAGDGYIGLITQNSKHFGEPNITITQHKNDHRSLESFATLLNPPFSDYVPGVDLKINGRSLF